MTDDGQHDLSELIRKSCEAFHALSPLDQAIHRMDQKRSGVHGLADFDSPLTREQRDAIIDKMPEFVVLKGLRDCRADLAAAQAEIERLKAERDEAREDARNRAVFMRSEGYRECDIMACNCNSWHGGHAYYRLREIRDVIDGEAFSDFNGVTTLEAVKRLFARIAVLEAERDRWRDTAGAAATELCALIADKISDERRRLGDERSADPDEPSDLTLSEVYDSEAAIADSIAAAIRAEAGKGGADGK